MTHSLAAKKHLSAEPLCKTFKVLKITNFIVNEHQSAVTQHENVVLHNYKWGNCSLSRDDLTIAKWCF